MKSAGTAIHEVWARLQDDLSREYFTQRLLYLLDGDCRHGENMVAAAYRSWLASGRRCPEANTFDPDAFPHDKNGPVVVFGAGWLGRQIAPLLAKRGFSDVRFCDANAALHGGTVDSVPVISPEALFAMRKAPVLIATRIKKFAREISACLRCNGCDPARIYQPPIIWDNEYFNPDFFAPSGREVYIDAGCYDSRTILEFVEFCGGKYEAIYGFEPDPESYKRMAGELEPIGLKNISFFQKGLWSSSGTLRFDNAPNGGAGIRDCGALAISTVALDALNASPTFIKMDIEGAELEALRGAEKTLRRCKPNLAVCVYHKNEDILDIPLYLRELVPEYRFYLRHHSYSLLDTVLYATARPMKG